MSKSAITWANSFVKPVITYKEDNTNEIPIKICRIRNAGELSQQFKLVITGEEIGNTTNTVPTPLCDEAMNAVRDDMKEQDIQR